jgi:hypothetical protein
MIDDQCGAIDGRRIGRGNRSPRQLRHDLIWAGTRAAAVGKPAINRLSNGAASLTPDKSVLFESQSNVATASGAQMKQWGCAHEVLYTGKMDMKECCSGHEILCDRSYAIASVRCNYKRE